jgi:hypothetical protein
MTLNIVTRNKVGKFATLSTAVSTVIMLNIIKLKVVFFSCFFECHSSECHYADHFHAEWHIAECNYTECHGAVIVQCYNTSLIIQKSRVQVLTTATGTGVEKGT